MLNDIKHIVVLMLENRSFDSMLGGLGKLYPQPTIFDGLDGTETNPDASGAPVPAWNQPGTDAATMRIPDPDPGEHFDDINSQLFDTPTPPVPTPTPTMSGFAKDYAAQPGAPSGSGVMHHFTPEQVPVISALARQFAVCDRWHASAPCQTWPNRFFVHTGTANGYENNSPTHFPYLMPTIFNRFDDGSVANPWKIYFHDMPQSLTLSNLWPQLERFRFYAEFQHDARTGQLPAYSFIEPRYFADVALPNDQHPPHVVTLGEQLIADVYNCLRAGPGWLDTLLIITYDEHGGCYDHVPPPQAQPPGAVATAPFNFDRYGVRVPAVIVSPWVTAGTILRPAGAVPYDHTSIIATVRKRFGLGAPLSARDAVAPDLGPVLDRPGPDNLGPERLEALPFAASPADVAAAQNLPLNSMQRNLLRLAGHLPATEATGDFGTFIQRHIAFLSGLHDQLAIDTNRSMADAVAVVRDRLGKLFRGL
jgi:phospholipase C